MSAGLLLLVAAIYLGVSWNYARRGQYGEALAWGAYAVANVGFAIR